ncbi:MAG: serine/threonine-protein kinase [Limnobacter sp.]|uniref:serine/threonine protein kinase n=1 Tax=Limnobacter sp. TaxID=2003368 RepID=UPI0022C64B21|nr:serine/threonine-protein kinase [Limnobacter sp.]MCZ8016048.1 serine/threonine-protein kinase [Limnobacter sp.]
MNDHTVIQSAPAMGGDPGQQPLPVGALIEGFEIRGIIGLGGFGIVYEAWDYMLERQVALKEYLPGTLAVRLPTGKVQVRDERHRNTFDAGMRSFINEARLLAQFDHAALVKVYRFWEMSGTAYMVMPLYRGITLKQHHEQQEEPLAESTLVPWLVALTEALEVMHQQQCYHRDISPENIIIQENTGLPILLDFGAARRAIGHVSQPFTVILKASYAPIEQYAELPSLTQGPWTDVYALAAVAHFLMTGKTPPSSVGRMVNDSYTPLVEQENLPFSTALKKAVDRALAVQPGERTQCMRQFREALLNQQPDVLDLFSPPTQGDKLQPNLASPVNSRQNKQEYGQYWRCAAGAGLLSVLILISLPWILTGTQVEQPVLIPSETSSAKEPSPETLPNEETTSAMSKASPDVYGAFQAVLNRTHFALEIQPKETVLKIGEDLLRFGIVSPISGYVAVYVRSSDNTLIQLLPNARVPAIRIESGQLLELPPANEPIQAAGPEGLNQFLIVVTEQARDYAHLKLQDHYGFGLIEHSVQNLEGTSPCSSTSCRDQMAAGWFSVEEMD